MDLFGLNRFFSVSQNSRPPKKGIGRYFEVLYDNLGAILGTNLLTCFGFLPLALGVSLGTVYENLWLTLLGGALGGALAGLCWTPLLSLCFQALRMGTKGWWRRWRRALALSPFPSALLGAALGLPGSGLLLVLTQFPRVPGMDSAVPFVSAVVLLDLFLMALAAAVCFPRLCAGGGLAAPGAVRLLLRAPLRALGAAAGLLAWGALLTALFPASVPFAVLLGFWPPALLCAQLLLPALEGELDLSALDAPDDAPRAAPSGGPALRERGEIFWRRRGPVVVILASLSGLVLWGGLQLLGRQEPDVQIAVIHTRALPDDVIAALEDALAAQVGDLNGDGQARVQLNDYVVALDGSAADPDRQAAGSTLLVSDMAAGVSALYVTEDPKNFLARYGSDVDSSAAALWADCPGLAALDAGVYVDPARPDERFTGQALLGGFTVVPGRSVPDAVLGLLERGSE